MKEKIEKIISKAFCDYRGNTISKNEMLEFSRIVRKIYGYELNKDYLIFITELNGFDLNGLSFYGTIEKKDLYILSAIKENVFWKAEIPIFLEYFLIGDGDMDFYCFDPRSKDFIALEKGSFDEVGRYPSFNNLLDKLINIYT